jgi:hypothetical protein
LDRNPFTTAGKKFHCLKYQAIVCPDGIIAHLYGPVEGVKHDIAIYRESGIEDKLEMHAYAPDMIPLQIYGDPAYGLNEHLISHYRGIDLTEEQKAFNKAMASIHIVVEWCFKEVLQRLMFLDLVRTQQTLLSPVGLQYPVTVLLHNAHVCLHRPQISQYFAQEHNKQLEEGMDDIPQLVAPPTLEEYFHLD